MSFAKPPGVPIPPPPPPPARSLRTAPQGSATPGSSGSSSRRILSLPSLPPPPPVAASAQSHHASNYSQSIAKSMTIEEMRALHQRALQEAEAKQTELRLVLASRYRELVGSSDEVIKMKERAQELHDLVRNLPGLMEKVAQPVVASVVTDEGKENSEGAALLVTTRRQLSNLPRLIYRNLDKNDIYKATAKIIELFTWIASQTDVYELANRLSAEPAKPQAPDIDPALEAQLRMVFLQMQTLPNKVCRMANRNLVMAASYGPGLDDATFGAECSAAALSALYLLDVQKRQDNVSYLLDIYYESKTKLVASLLNKLSSDITNDDEQQPNLDTANAEDILSKIVLILQYDVILHPYQIFCLRSFPCQQQNDDCDVMNSLPNLDTKVVKAKCTKFLAFHLPLIRNKVKAILVSIAGTTASALGQIRQSLYDKTDGAEKRLNAVCSWDDAVLTLVDTHTVSESGGAMDRRFSLWSNLFSNTFSSLVHSLLTSAFQSVHTRVVSRLRASLANAPPMANILPHEAYRNTLQIATELNEALLKVSDDAHELLVHAEERVESERRLRQSLYVQTCEIMGRLVCELRRMIQSSDEKEATKELIVGRLCYLLKFRLTSLPSLLEATSSPGAMHATTGMISFVDMQSAFELADDDEDGLIKLNEAMEAMESAFSGTQFRGAEMVRETLLISPGQGDDSVASNVPNVTLNELVLLAARGLRHDGSGQGSALGAVQNALDDIVHRCFRAWSIAALKESTDRLQHDYNEFLRSACTSKEDEWRRLYAIDGGQSVSVFVMAHLLDVSALLNGSICPLDALSPVPSMEYAATLGIVGRESSLPTLNDNLRDALLLRSFESVIKTTEDAIKSLPSLNLSLDASGPVALFQHHLDMTFVKQCFLEKRQPNSGPDYGNLAKRFDAIEGQIETKLKGKADRATLQRLQGSSSEARNNAYEVTSLSLSSLFGDDNTAASTSGLLDVGVARSSGSPLCRAPLHSTTRFVLLPVQADRSLSEIQMRGKYAKEKESSPTSRSDGVGAGVMSSGLGFLSSMLKKN